MACHSVFEVTELLENILVFLPLPDLLRVQVVCKHWKQIIAGSSVVQEQLFLRPAKKDSVWLVDVVNLPRGMGPLPRRYPSVPQVKAAVSPRSQEYRSHYGLVVTPVQMNSQILTLDQEEDAHSAHHNTADFKAENGTALRLRSLFSEKDTCQEMFLTQPPVQKVYLEGREYPDVQDLVARLVLDGMSRAGHSATKIFVEDGVRLKHVTAYLRKWIEEGNADMEDHAIYLQGAMCVNDADELFVAHRTKRWHEKRRNDNPTAT